MTTDLKRARATLFALTALNFLNYLDRQAVFSLYTPIKRDLGLSDSQLGILGTACLLVLALASIPFGRIADRAGERGVVAAGVVAWCVGVVAAARAMSFRILALGRATVGLGEAAYEPAANAFICHELAPGAKATALSIFNIGTVLGLAAGGILAGLIAKYIGWRNELLLLGLAGLPFVLIALKLPAGRKREPAHHASRGAITELLRKPAMIFTLLGGTCASFAAGGLLAWMVSFVERAHHFSTKDANVYTGLVAIPCAFMGVLIGGRFSDALDRWRPAGAGRALSIAIPIGIAALPAALGVRSVHPAGFFVGAGMTMFLGGFYNGPSAALISELAPVGQAALAQGILLFTIHCFGDAPAPYVVGWLSDHHGGLRTALLLPCMMLALAGLCFAIASRFAPSEPAVAGEGERHLAGV